MEPVVVKPIEWKDHLSMRDNLEMMKIVEVFFGLLCNMELFVTLFVFFYNLFTIKNTYQTTIFLLFMTFLILYFETVFPLCLIACAFKMVSHLYKHERFKPEKPDIKYNIQFIRSAAEVIASTKYFIDLFIVDRVYWGDQKQAVKLVAWLLIMAGISFIGLNLLIGIRLIILIGLYGLVGYNS